MLAIIVTKLLLQGAIKSFLVQPVISATMTMIPQHVIVNASMLGTDIAFSSSDLLKFGIDKLYEHFVAKQLDFKIEKIAKYVFGIAPASELAELFTKEYYTEQELIVDLTRFESHIDTLLGEFASVRYDPSSPEFDEDQVLQQVIQDLDLAVNRSSDHLFDSVRDEERLIEEILEKNMRLIPDPERDFPRPPTSLPEIKEDEKEIDAILSKFA